MQPYHEVEVDELHVLVVDGHALDGQAVAAQVNSPGHQHEEEDPADEDAGRDPQGYVDAPELDSTVFSDSGGNRLEETDVFLGFSRSSFTGMSATRVLSSSGNFKYLIFKFQVSKFQSPSPTLWDESTAVARRAGHGPAVELGVVTGRGLPGAGGTPVEEALRYWVPWPGGCQGVHAAPHRVPQVPRPRPIALGFIADCMDRLPTIGPSGRRVSCWAAGWRTSARTTPSPR
jgi:hypothetical protein